MIVTAIEKPVQHPIDSRMIFTPNALLIVILVLLTPLKAQSESENHGGAFNSWFIHASGAGTVLQLNDEGSPYRLSVGAGRPVLKNKLTLLLNGVYTFYDVNNVADNNPSPDVRGGHSHSLGLDLIVRKPYFQTPHMSCHFEGGAGLQWILTDPHFPADGSDGNFTALIGHGVLIPVNSDLRLCMTLEWFHISNANLLPNNSGYDGIQLLIGFEWGL